MNTRGGINAALKIIGLAGLTATVIAAPNATQALAVLLRRSSARQTDYQKIIRELRRQGLISISKVQDEYGISLSPAGAQRLQQVIVDELEIPKPKKWDNQWRLVAFDIPVNLSKQRVMFTNQLGSMGFYMFQRSLWVHPFPCFEQVEQLAGHYNILRHCTFIEVNQLDNIATKRLVSHFAPLISES